MSREYPLSVQIGELERELRVRAQVYPGQIARGNLKAAEAVRRVAILEEAIATLKDLREQGTGNGQ
jgi:hypothetical protein